MHMQYNNNCKGHAPYTKEERSKVMSNKKKKGKHNTIEYIVLATAILELVKTIIELLNTLL